MPPRQTRRRVVPQKAEKYPHPTRYGSHSSMIDEEKTEELSDKNLVEQGFVFEQLVSGHQCGCGESFTPVKDINKSNGPFS